MPSNQAVGVGVGVGILLTLLMQWIWAYFPYPGQLLLVLLIIGGVIGGAIRALLGLSDPSAMLLGRVTAGVACVVLFLPFVGLLMRFLRAAFHG